MRELTIRGGTPLCGRVHVGGAKNSALPILFATILTGARSVVYGLAAIGDVRLAHRILACGGAELQHIDEHTSLIDTHAYAPGQCTSELSRGIRASVYTLGAELGRFGYSRCPLPGGCDFGKRPIDLHLMAFERLGARVECDARGITLRADRLVGCEIDFPSVSVGATVNAILAATRAEGTTVLHGAACEPIISHLASYINLCGGSVSGAGSSTVTVIGTDKMHGTAIEIPGDIMEAGTFLIAGAATGGCVTTSGIAPAELSSLTDLLTEMGAEVSSGDHSITAAAPSPLEGTTVVTAPYPGFPTDLHPQLASLLTVCRGEGRVCERVWSDRFRYTEELKKTGADITVVRPTVIVRGSIELHPASMCATDLRGGAAMVISALAIPGTSTVTSAELIARGYENLAGKLRCLGARVTER